MGGNPHRTGLLAGAVLAVVLLVATGCGADEKPRATRSDSADAGTPADRACRERWGELTTLAQGHAREGEDVRSAFADRWNAVTAGAEYYRHTATADRCGSLLDQRRAAVAALAQQQRFALPFDPAARLTTATTLRSLYRTLPGGTKEPGAVKKAYQTLAAKTPTASRELRPAFTELAAADPDDAKATKQARADVRLLANASDADAACRAAVARIQQWQAKVGAKPKKKS